MKGWPWHTTAFAQWDGTATLLNGGSYFNRGLHVITLRSGKVYPRCLKIPKTSPVGLPSKRQLASKRLPPNKL